MTMKKRKSQDELDVDIKKLKHYVDNVKFNKEMIEWKKLIQESEDCDEKRPPVTNYIAECFLKIAEHLSYRPNFMNYPYREDMVGDGIENCLLYAHNFDPSKSNNPFSYFTQIIYYAFLRRIEKEKKIKEASIASKDVFGAKEMAPVANDKLEFSIGLMKRGQIDPLKYEWK